MYSRLLWLCALAVLSSGAAALGIDLGPVHIHGTKVKIGNTIELKIIPDKITNDEDEKDRVRKIKAHRKGDPNDEFLIKVIWADLDDKSKKVLKKLETDTIYVARLEKLSDDWKLLRIRTPDDEDDDKEKAKDKE